MKVNSILKLENNKNYIILKKINYQNEEYYLAFNLLDDKKINPDDLIYLMIEKEQADIYINIVEDKNILNRLIKRKFLD